MKNLKDRSTYVIAPSFKADIKSIPLVKDFLKRHNFIKQNSLKNLFGKSLLFAHSDEQRFSEIKKALQIKSSILWSYRGGYGAVRLLEALAAVKHPKYKPIFIGYSDFTVIHAFVNQFWQLPSLHFSGLEAIVSKRVRKSDFNKVLQLLNHRDAILRNKLSCLNSFTKKISANVVGGNLTVYMSLFGTRFQPEIKNKILFFEDVNERGYQIDRLLMQLRLNKDFKKVKAIVFAEFIGGNEPSSTKNYVQKVLKQFAKEVTVPVFYGFPAGHGNKQCPVILGSRMQIQYDDEKTIYCQQRTIEEWFY
jgi:muramoyltetrapeptide carboxypeptidase